MSSLDWQRGVGFVCQQLTVGPFRPSVLNGGWFAASCLRFLPLAPNLRLSQGCGELYGQSELPSPSVLSGLEPIGQGARWVARATGSLRPRDGTLQEHLWSIRPHCLGRSTPRFRRRIRAAPELSVGKGILDRNCLKFEVMEGVNSITLEDE